VLTVVLRRQAFPIWVKKSFGPPYRRIELRGCLGLLCSTFFSSALRFFSQTVSAPRTQFEKKGWSCESTERGTPRTPVFLELLHSGVCGAEFVEQCQTPPKYHSKISVKESIFRVILSQFLKISPNF